jgi:hypothetical protein
MVGENFEIENPRNFKFRTGISITLGSTHNFEIFSKFVELSHDSHGPHWSQACRSSRPQMAGKTERARLYIWTSSTVSTQVAIPVSEVGSLTN